MTAFFRKESFQTVVERPFLLGQWDHCVVYYCFPERVHLVSWPRVVWVWPSRGQLLFIVYSCLGLLSCIEFCIFLRHLVLFVSTFAKWLAGKTYSRDIFRIEEFPLQRPDSRVIYCNGLLYVFPTRNVVNIIFNFPFLTATYLSRAQYSLFVQKVSLNPKQSIYQLFVYSRTEYKNSLHIC